MTEQRKTEKGQALLRVVEYWSQEVVDLFSLSGQEIIDDDDTIEDARIFLSAILELHEINPELIEAFRKDFVYWATDWDDVDLQYENELSFDAFENLNRFRALVAKVQKLFADTLAD